MYNPALPNHYHDVLFTAYVRRRQREEKAALERQRQPNALASALSDLDGTAEISSSSRLHDFPSSVSASSAGPSGLGLSAEELHRRRIQESAALGIQSAVEMEKAELESEHQRRKLEGADARSRISSRLDKLKALAQKSKKLAGAPTTAEGDDSSAAAASGTPDTDKDAPSSPSSSAIAASSAQPSSTTSSAPLTFQRSSLAAGGFIMTSAPTLPPRQTSTQQKSAQVSPRPLSPAPCAVRGKPSSTLLLRFCRTRDDLPQTSSTRAEADGLPPALEWSEAQLTAAAASPAATAALCDPLLRQLEGQCRRFGVVRGVKARIYAAAAVTAVLGMAATDTAGLRREQVRLWVRYDSVTEAFKAATSLAKEAAAAEGGPAFSVCFYPTGLYDADTLELRVEDGQAVL